MSRTAKQNRQRGKSCGEYRDSIALAGNGEYCELTRWLTPDREAIRWISNEAHTGFQVHHIESRGPSTDHEAWCNLILLSSSVHSWVERQRPAAGNLACLYAKYRKHLDQQERMKKSGLNLLMASDRLQWSPAIMGGIVLEVSLAGSISRLMDKVGDGIYFEYGLEMLKVLELN